MSVLAQMIRDRMEVAQKAKVAARRRQVAQALLQWAVFLAMFALVYFFRDEMISFIQDILARAIQLHTVITSRLPA